MHACGGHRLTLSVFFSFSPHCGQYDKKQLQEGKVCLVYHFKGYHPASQGRHGSKRRKLTGHLRPIPSCQPGSASALGYLGIVVHWAKLERMNLSWEGG